MEDIIWYIRGGGEKINHNDLNCNLSRAGSGLAWAAGVSFPLGQLGALCWAGIHVGLLFVVTGQSKGELGRLSQGGSQRATIQFYSRPDQDTMGWPGLIRTEKAEGGVKSVLTPSQAPGTVVHHPRNTKDAPHESSPSGFKKSNIQTVDPDSPWLLTKKLSINDDDEHWRLSYISLPILSVRAFKFVGNQSDIVVGRGQSWDNDGQANLQMDISIFWYISISRHRHRWTESRNTNHNITALPAPFKYTSTGSKVD